MLPRVKQKIALTLPSTYWQRMITGVVASRYAVIFTSLASDLMHNVLSMFLKYVVKFSALGRSPEADISFKRTKISR